MKLLQDDVVDGSAVDLLAVDGSAAGHLGEVDLVVVTILLGSAGQDGTRGVDADKVLCEFLIGNAVQDVLGLILLLVIGVILCQDFRLDELCSGDLLALLECPAAN